MTIALLSACRNTPPTAPELAIDPVEPTTVDDLVASITLDAVDDDKKDEVTYTWAWSQNGTARGDLTSDTVPAAETARGDEWTVTLVATDGEAEVSASGSVTVGNTAPVMESATLESASPGAADDIVVLATGTDVDGDALTYSYSWTVDGESSDITGPRVVASETLPEQTWVVSVTALDDELESAPMTATALVGNSVPVVEVTAIKPSEPSRMSTLTADVTASDPDGSDVTLSYSWTVGGVEVGTEASLEASSLSVGDEVSVTVSASDGIDSTSHTVASAAVIVDLAPVVSGVLLSPSSPTKAGNVTALVTATDAESDPITFTYRWFVSGSEVLAGTSDTLAPDHFSKGQSIHVQVVPNDGYLDGALVSSGSYTVANTPPTLTGATIPGEVTRTSGATCVGEGFADIDGDPEGYQVRWLVNGSEVSLAATLSGNLYALGDSVQCVLAPFDGTATGSSVSSDVVVVTNALPTLASVELSSTAPREGDVLSASLGTLSDADGDTVEVSYAWEVNGSVVATTPTLASDSFKKGDTVTVTVTPNDGTDDGAPVTSSPATVQNTAPTAPEVGLQPDYPNESENLQCVVTQASVDADNDTVQYEVSWTVDGSPFSGSVSETVFAGDTVPSTALEVGQVWSCEVTPSDDEDDGSSATSDEATISPPSNGSSQGAAGESCATINDLYPGLSDGSFWIDPNGGSKSDAYEAFCDMTMDGGGWTLLSWSGDTNQQPYGVPYPGIAPCPDMDCVRGTLGSRDQIAALTSSAGAYAKGQSDGSISTFGPLDGYPYAGKYVYDDLSTITPDWASGSCTPTDAIQGTFHSLKGAEAYEGAVVYISPGFRYSTADYSSESNAYWWHIGVPESGCSGSANMPGTWMGTYRGGHYGPVLRNVAGAAAIYVR